MECFKCKTANLEQRFCGHCGAALNLEEFITSQVEANLAQRTQQKDLVERESSIRIFERTVGYFKVFATVAVIVVAPVAFIGIYKWSDLYKTIDTAKTSIPRGQKLYHH